MTTNPLCERCGQEILPGTDVEILGMDDQEDKRIFVGEELIVVHATCPEAPAVTIRPELRLDIGLLRKQRNWLIAEDEGGDLRHGIVELLDHLLDAAESHDD